MSKAILIIDVNENADFENAIADITFRENEWGLAPRGIKRWHNGIKAKPLPTTEQIKALLKKGYDFMSFEELLDEILGDNDE